MDNVFLHVELIVITTDCREAIGIQGKVNQIVIA